MYQLQQLISEPTRVTNTSATLIDLIFTNDLNNIAKSGVICYGISDHSIYVIRTFIPNKRRQIKKEVRNLKHFVEEDFIHDLHNTGCIKKKLNKTEIAVRLCKAPQSTKFFIDVWVLIM